MPKLKPMKSAASKPASSKSAASKPASSKSAAPAPAAPAAPAPAAPAAPAMTYNKLMASLDFSKSAAHTAILSAIADKSLPPALVAPVSDLLALLGDAQAIVRCALGGSPIPDKYMAELRSVYGV